ncbi:MAG: TonB-dependent receptor plug domain-containing protein, partial [Methylococcaceae bacterium]|nr:TonB-dependent receptor plug domain-containing protein [Methylococcaceae bacterium]
MRYKKTVLLGLVILPIAVSAAQDNSAIELPPMEVTGSGEKDILNMSSSSTILDEKELFQSHVSNVNEALRKIPGVYVRDEEGFGIRPNIGFRGM